MAEAKPLRGINLHALEKRSTATRTQLCDSEGGRSELWKSGQQLLEHSCAIQKEVDQRLNRFRCETKAGEEWVIGQIYPQVNGTGNCTN